MALNYLNPIVDRAIDKILEEQNFQYEPSEIMLAFYESEEPKKRSFKKRKTEETENFDTANLRLFSENTYWNYIKKDVK